MWFDAGYVQGEVELVLCKGKRVVGRCVQEKLAMGSDG